MQSGKGQDDISFAAHQFLGEKWWYIVKLACYRNYYSFNQILHCDKDYQILFVGGSKHAYNKSKIGDGSHFEKSKMAISVGKKFGMVMHTDPPSRVGNKNI